MVALGAARRVPYSKAGDPAGAAPGENALKISPLVVDGNVKEWTTGDAHDVTDRSFVVRRAMRLNDELPGEKPGSASKHWVWQRGPWLLVDRVTGHITALKLPDYDPGVSQVMWFRDYAAYCGITASGKSLYAVVAQIAASKPVLARKLAPLSTCQLIPSRPAIRPNGSANRCGPPSTRPARTPSVSTLCPVPLCWSKTLKTKPKRLRHQKLATKLATACAARPGCAKLEER